MPLHKPVRLSELRAKSSAAHSTKGMFAEGRLIAYSSGNFGKHLVFAGAEVTFLFLLTDLFGLSPTMAGTLMLVALAGDLLFDLLAAAAVIRLRRTGRGYRWLIIAGSTPGGAAFALLYAMPAIGGDQGWILALALLSFRGAYAVIDVPHNALMAQISSDSRARGRISGYRLLFSAAGALAVASILTPAVQDAARTHSFGTLAVTGVVAGILFALTMTACALACSGRSDGPPAAKDGLDIPIRDGLVLAMGLIAVITGLAMPAFERMLIYLGSYVIARPELVGTLLLAKSAGTFVGALIWTPLAGRIDKSRLLMIGYGSSAVGFILFGLCLDLPEALPACAVIIGIGLSCIFMLPWGLLADTVDFVAWRHGRRFETGLFGYYLVAVKASGAASAALIGWALGGLGYVPGGVQPASVHAGMVALGLGLPLLGCIGAVILLRRLEIGHDRHARLLVALRRRTLAQDLAQPTRSANALKRTDSSPKLVLPAG